MYASIVQYSYVKMVYAIDVPYAAKKIGKK